MKCPNCETILNITQRYNVEIDYCPSCRGVWLDKGELDKIISLANEQTSSFSKKDDDYDDDDRDFGHKEHGKDSYKSDKGYYKKKNDKKSFLSDLFGFD
jgi:uncharacterized protein